MTINSFSSHIHTRLNSLFVMPIMTNTEKDLGFMISGDLKPSNQCSKVVKTANKLVGFIGRTFKHKSEKVILTLYTSLVHPLLEYCIQFWFP